MESFKDRQQDSNYVDRGRDAAAAVQRTVGGQRRGYCISPGKKKKCPWPESRLSDTDTEKGLARYYKGRRDDLAMDGWMWEVNEREGQG